MVKKVGSTLQRQTRFANAAGAGEGEETDMFVQQKLLNRRKFMLTPNQGRAR